MYYAITKVCIFHHKLSFLHIFITEPVIISDGDEILVVLIRFDLSTNTSTTWWFSVSSFQFPLHLLTGDLCRCLDLC